MKLLRYGKAARRDIGAITRYVSTQTGDDRAGRTVAAAIVAQCEKLAELPSLMGRPRTELRDGLRSFPFRGYVIFFHYPGDILEIVNVLNARQDIDAYFGKQIA